MLRVRQAELHHRNQAHAAGKRFRALGQQSQRFVQRFAGRGSCWAAGLGVALQRVPAIHEAPQIVLTPAQVLEQVLIDLILRQLILEPIEHEVGRLAGVVEIGRIFVWVGRLGAGSNVLSGASPCAPLAA